MPHARDSRGEMRLRGRGDNLTAEPCPIEITVEGCISDLSAQTTPLLRDWVTDDLVPVSQYQMTMEETGRTFTAPQRVSLHPVGRRVHRDRGASDCVLPLHLRRLCNVPRPSRNLAVV